MKNISSKSIVYFILLDSFLFWFLADFFSKKWAISDQFNPWSVIDGFFYLIPFQKNEGIAFSIPVPLWLQIGGSVVIVFFLARLGLKYVLAETHRVGLKTFFLGMALGGGLGNLVDRISQQYVVDFIVLGPIPVFNVADVGITVGLIGLFATMLLESKTNIKS